MVSFKRVSCLLCLCAMLCCFIGLAMPVSADGAITVFDNEVLSFSHLDLDVGYVYGKEVQPTDELWASLVYLLESGESVYLTVNGDIFEVTLTVLEESITTFIITDDFYYGFVMGFIDDVVTVGFYSDTNLGSSVSISFTNYQVSTDNANSALMGDLGSVAASGLDLVSDIVTTIVDNPFLLLTVGFFFAGAAVAVLGRILGKS